MTSGSQIITISRCLAKAFKSGRTVHSDGAVLGDYVKKFFNDIPHNNKVLHWTEGTQFDFYDQPKQVTESVAPINVFFKNNINYII